MIEDLRLRYADIEVSPRYLRLYRPEDPNGRMFGYFQMRLNELFKFMDHKAQSNSHYNAKGLLKLCGSAGHGFRMVTYQRGP